MYLPASAHPLKGSSSPAPASAPWSCSQLLQMYHGADTPGHNCPPPAARETESKAPPKVMRVMGVGVQLRVGDAVRKEARSWCWLDAILRLPLEFTSNEQKVSNSACAAPCPYREACRGELASPSPPPLWHCSGPERYWMIPQVLHTPKWLFPP